MKRYHKVHILSNIIVPLLAGAVIYYFMSEDVIFVKAIKQLIGEGRNFNFFVEKNVVLKFIRFYLLDMLWGYALVFSLYLVLDDNAAKFKRIFLIAFVFSAFMEFLQLTPFAEGTFDFVDILFELLSEVFAVFIIKYTYEEATK